MRSAEVLIIESSSPEDHFETRQTRREGSILQQVLALSGVRSKYLEVVNTEYLRTALVQAEKEQSRYVHFSCHGSYEGITLTDGALVSWADFDSLGWPALQRKCLVFSSCDVGKSVKRLFSFHKSFCNAIVAPTRNITWAEGVVAYCAFYHRATLHTETEVDVRVMNHIVGRGSFVVHFSPYSRTTYVIGKQPRSGGRGA